MRGTGWVLGVALAVTLLVAACAGGAGGAGGAVGSPLASNVGGGGRVALGADGEALGPGLSIAEAVNASAHGPLFVRGFLVADGDTVRLCTALTRSLPPQCAGPSLTVVGFDPGSRALEQTGTVRWSATELTLLGDVDGGMLTTYGTASA